MTDTDASLLARLEEILAIKIPVESERPFYIGMFGHGRAYTFNGPTYALLSECADALRRSGEALRRLQEEVDALRARPSGAEIQKEEEARSASPQFTVVYVEGHDGKTVAAPCCLSGCQYNEALKDALYHRDCRPNRRKAEAAIADAKAMNDKWADERVRAEKAESSLQQIGAVVAPARALLVQTLPIVTHDRPHPHMFQILAYLDDAMALVPAPPVSDAKRATRSDVSSTGSPRNTTTEDK